MKKGNIFLILLILVLSLVPFLWFQKNHFIMGGDLTFPLKPFYYLKILFYNWIPQRNGGIETSVSPANLSYHLFPALLDIFRISPLLIQKIVFAFWFILPGLSMYFLISVLTDKPAARFFGAFFYMFNVFSFHLFFDASHQSAYVTLPLILGLIIKGAEGRSKPLTTAYLAALAGIVGSATLINPPRFLVYLLAIFLLLIYLLVLQKRNFKLSFILWFLPLFVLFNLYWLLPIFQNFFLKSVSPGDSLTSLNLLNWLDSVSKNASFLNVLRMQGAWDWYAGWQEEPYIVYSYIYRLPLFVFFGLFLALFSFSSLFFSKNRYLPYFGLITLLGLILGMGTYPTFRTFYQWATEHIPLFWTFRSPWYKFTLLVALGYAVMFGFAVEWVYQFFYHRRRFLSFFFLGLIFVLNLAYLYPFLQGKQYPKATERKILPPKHVQIPSYIYEAADWLNQQKWDNRILHLPKTQSFVYKWDYGKLDDPTFYLTDKDFLYYANQIGSPAVSDGIGYVVNLFYRNFYNKEYSKAFYLLKILGAKYLLQKNDIRYDFYGGKDSPDFIGDLISSQSAFRKIKTFGFWDFYLFDSPDVLPRIYSSFDNFYIMGSLTDLEDFMSFNNLQPAWNLFFASNNSVNSDLLKKQSQNIGISLADQSVVSKGDELIFNIEDIPAQKYWLYAKNNKNFREEIEIGDQKFRLTRTKNNDEWVRLGEVSLTKPEKEIKIYPDSTEILEKNMITNSSFENDKKNIQWSFIDCSSGGEGKSQIEMFIDSSHSDGKQSLGLTSSRHSACLYQDISDFDSEAIYKFSFDYRYIKGKKPKFSLIQKGAETVNPPEPLNPDLNNHNWQHYENFFKPDSNATSLSVYFYAESDGNQATSNLYDNVKLIKLTKFTDLVLQSQDSSVNFTPAISYQKISPTKYKINIVNATQPYFLNFLDSYNFGWKAYIKNKKIPQEKHFMVNGYANSWYIDKLGSYEITLEYWPQEVFTLGLFISIISIISVSIYLFIKKYDQTQQNDN